MSLANIQDNLVKNFLVQPFQSRGDETQRLNEQVRVQYEAERTRKADEAVIQATPAEQEGIRPDREDHQGQYEPQRRPKKKNGEEEGEEEAPSEGTAPSGEGHFVDIVV